MSSRMHLITSYFLVMKLSWLFNNIYNQLCTSKLIDWMLLSSEPNGLYASAVCWSRACVLRSVAAPMISSTGSCDYRRHHIYRGTGGWLLDKQKLCRLPHVPRSCAYVRYVIKIPWYSLLLHCTMIIRACRAPPPITHHQHSFSLDPYIQ